VLEHPEGEAPGTQAGSRQAPKSSNGLGAWIILGLVNLWALLFLITILDIAITDGVPARGGPNWDTLSACAFMVIGCASAPVSTAFIVVYHRRERRARAMASNSPGLIPDSQG
jgi:hypothetical protein